MELHWAMPKDDHGYYFFWVRLGKAHAPGVYVIWEMLDPTLHQRVMRVGQSGDLSQRIKQHRSNWGWHYRGRDLG
jgi:hypothetical protein